jgi:hypothetical protein
VSASEQNSIKSSTLSFWVDLRKVSGLEGCVGTTNGCVVAKSVAKRRNFMFPFGCQDEVEDENLFVYTSATLFLKYACVWVNFDELLW